jgi:hypothetical protein
VLTWQFNRFLVVAPWPTAPAARSSGRWLSVVLFRLVRPVRAPALVYRTRPSPGRHGRGWLRALANRGLIGLWAKGVGIHFAANWSASLSP